MSLKGCPWVFLSFAWRLGPQAGIVPPGSAVLRWRGAECRLKERGALLGASGQPEVSRAQELAVRGQPGPQRRRALSAPHSLAP